MSDPFRFQGAQRAVGVFLLAALGVIVAGLLLTGSSRHWFESAESIELEIPAAEMGMLRPGLPVKMLGSPAGEVVTVDTTVRTENGSGWVRVRLSLARSFRDALRADASATIRTPVAGLFGETFVDLVPGSAYAALAAGERLRARPQADLLADAHHSVEQLGAMANEMRAMIAENRAVVQAVLAGASRLLTRVDTLGEQVGSVIAENRAGLKGASDRLPATLDTVRDSAREAGALAGEARATLAENRPALKATTDLLVPVVQRLDALAADLGIITAQVASGEGTIGKLVMQDEVHDRLVALTEELSAKIEAVSPVLDSLLALQLYGGVEGGANTDTRAATGHVYLRIEPRPWKFFQAGVSYRSAPERRNVDRDDADGVPIDFNLLMGWRWFEREPSRYWLSVAGGVVESRLGGWVDLSLLPADRLTVRTMVRDKMDERDPDDRRYERGTVLVRSVAYVRVWSRVYLAAGGDDLADDPAAWVGLRAELLDNDLRSLAAVAGVLK